MDFKKIFFCSDFVMYINYYIPAKYNIDKHNSQHTSHKMSADL